jgi:hypothetical protein
LEASHDTNIEAPQICVKWLTPCNKLSGDIAFAAKGTLVPWQVVISSIDVILLEIPISNFSMIDISY